MLTSTADRWGKFDRQLCRRKCWRTHVFCPTEVTEVVQNAKAPYNTPTYLSNHTKPPNIDFQLLFPTFNSNLTKN